MYFGIGIGIGIGWKVSVSVSKFGIGNSLTKWTLIHTSGLRSTKVDRGFRGSQAVKNRPGGDLYV